MGGWLFAVGADSLVSLSASLALLALTGSRCARSQAVQLADNSTASGSPLCENPILTEHFRIPPNRDIGRLRRSDGVKFPSKP